MRAAENMAIAFDAEADYPATAIIATRGERFNGAFKRIELMGFTLDGDLEQFVVFVSAGFTF
jgi:hypothetical protein